MGLAILFFIHAILIFAINGRSIYVFLRDRSPPAAIAGASSILALVFFVTIFFIGSETTVGRASARFLPFLASVILTLISLVACATARSRARARRGDHAWVSFLHVPFLATPLLVGIALAIWEFFYRRPP